MKSIRKHRLQTHQLIRSWLQPKLGAVGARYRLTARVRWANLWAKKTSQANLCLRDGLAVVAVGRHCRFGTCADRQYSNSRHECHCQHGTALHRLSCHSSQQKRASAETVGTDFPRAGCPGRTGFHDCHFS